MEPIKQFLSELKIKRALKKREKRARLRKAKLLSCYFEQIGLNGRVRNIDRNANPIWR